MGIFLLTAAFNIGVRADDTGIRVSILWIPVLHIRFKNIQAVEHPTQSPLLERVTFGVHFISGAISYHVGPATVSLTLANGKKVRITMKPAGLVAGRVRSSRDNPVPT